MRWRNKRKLYALLAILAVLIAFRIALPFIVTRYVNNVLSDLPGYRGHIDGVTIHLIRGAYQIDSLKVFKVDGQKEIPFIDIPLMDLSLEWDALFKGEIVGEVDFHKPVLNFITSKKEGEDEPSTQAGEDVDWTAPIKRLMPLQINRLTISDGKIMFYDFTTDPKVDLFLDHVQLDAQNLNNASEHADLLPSRVFMQAQSIGNGTLSISMKINVMKEIPDLDLDLKFEGVKLTALNDFFGAYAQVDVEGGDFNLYSELAVLDGEITGYVKPLLNNLKVVDWEKDKKKPLEMMWESVVGFLAEVFENQPENQFATRVPLQGNLANVESPFWPTLWNIFRNAFIEAFEQNTEDAINISATDNTEKSKKEIRKEKREKRKADREARRAAKRERKKDESNS